MFMYQVYIGFAVIRTFNNFPLLSEERKAQSWWQSLKKCSLMSTSLLWYSLSRKGSLFIIHIVDCKPQQQKGQQYNEQNAYSVLPINLHIPIFIKWVSSKQFLIYSFSSLFMHLQTH